MPTPTAEASPVGGRREKKEESFDSAKYAKSLAAELANNSDEELDGVKDLPDGVRDTLDVSVEEATRDPKTEVDEARGRIDAIHSRLDVELRDALEEGLRDKARSGEVGKLSADADAETVRGAHDRADSAIDSHVVRLIDEASLDKVYNQLKSVDSARLRSVLEAIAKDLPQYQFESKYIDGVDVLQSDLEAKFADLTSKLEAVSEARKSTLTGFLEKRAATTKQFIDARQSIDNSRKSGEAAAIDITAMAENIDGTYEASKEMNDLVNKGPLVSKRRYWDKETKSHVVELVYQVYDSSDKRNTKVNQKEAIVEYWNDSKDGGELIRSTYVRVGKETAKKGLQLKFWKGRKEVEQDARVLKVRKNPIGRYQFDLSDSAREQVSELSGESIEASKRSDRVVGGLKGRRAARATMAGRLGTYGMSSKEAGRVADVGRGRTKGFIQDLSERLFHKSSKISKRA